MPRAPKFKVVNTPQGWRVNVPASLSESGKRERHFHKTRDKALEHASLLRQKFQEHGEAATVIRPSLAEAATTAERILKPWGVSLVEAAKMVAEIRQREEASEPLDAAVDAWLLACSGLRDRTMDGYRQISNRLKASFGDRLMASISTDELQETIAPLGSKGTAVQGRIRNAKAFWRWAARKGWCDEAVFKAIEVPKTGRNQSEISILSIKEARTLLRTAEKHYPEAVASYALQLFAGIRVEELKRLTAENVTPDGIEMSASVTKKGRRRHINPNPTLTAWLEAYPYAPCTNWVEVDKACRRLSGWEVQARLLEIQAKRGGKKLKPERPSLGKWPQNALRHSHASYAVAIGTPLETLLFEFGHTGGPSVLREHYVGRASKKEGISFFSIGPNGTEVQTIAAA